MARKPKLSEEEVQELIEMYKNNDIDIKDICDNFSISKRTLYRLVDKYNIQTRIKVTILTEEIEREIIELYKQGESIKDIFDKFSIDKKTLYRLIDKYDIPRRGAGNKIRTLVSEETEKEIIKMYQDGELVKDIAKKFSVTRSAINYYIAKNELDKRKKCMSYLKELPEEDIQNIINMYQEGIPVKDICYQYLFDNSTLRRILDAYNIPRLHQKHKNFDEDTIKNIIKMYRDGERIKDIAKKFSVSTTTVNNYINKYDVSKRKQCLDNNELKGGNNMAIKRKLTEDQIQKLIEMYNNYIDIEDICNKFTISRFTLYKYLNRYNVPKRYHGSYGNTNARKYSDEVLQEVIELYKQNIPIKDISDRLSISENAINYYANKFNIPKRRRESGCKKFLTEEVQQEIIELYKQKVPVKDICEKFSISAYTVNYYISKYDICKRNKKIELDESTQQEIIELYKQKVPVKDICDIFSFDKSKLWKILDLHNVDRNHMNSARKNLDEDTIKEIIKMYQDGEIINDICDKFSITRATVNYYLNKFNITKRSDIDNTRKNFDEDTIKKIIKMYQDGVFIDNICDKFSISPGTVNYYLNKFNIPKRNDKRCIKQKQRLNIVVNNELKGENNMAKTNVEENAEVVKFIEMLKNGASENDIAMEFGISKDIVSHLANKYAVKCEEAETLTDLEEKIVKMYNSKAKLIVICKRLKVSNGFIYSTLKKAKSLGYTVKSRIVRESKIDTKLAQRVKALRECGASLSETSKLLGIPIGSINGYVNLCDDNTEDIIDTIADIPLTKKQQQIVDLYVKGASIDSISDKYNISATGINHCIDTARKNGQDIPVTINTLDARCILFKELPKEVKDKIYFIYYCLDFTIPNTVKWFKSVDPCFNHSTLNKLMHEWGVDKKCKSYNSVQREAFELRKQIYTDFISSGLSVQEYCAKGDTLIIEPALEIIIDQFSNNEKQVTPIVDTPIEAIQESPIMENQQQIEEVKEVVVEDTTDNNSDEVIEVVDTSSKNNEIKKITNTCTHVYCTFFQDRHYFPDFVKSTIYEKRGLDSYTMFNMDYLYKKSKEFIESNVTFDTDGNANADIICYMSGLQTVTGALMKACLDLKVNLTFMHYNKESDEWYKQPVIDVYSSGDSLMNKLVDMLGGSSDYSEYKYNDLYTHGKVDLSDSFYIVKMTYFDENENPYHVQGYLDMQGWDLHNQFAREMYENPSIKSKVDLYQVFHDETKASGFKIVGSICSSYNFAPTSRKK